MDMNFAASPIEQDKVRKSAPDIEGSNEPIVEFTTHTQSLCKNK
jgi:hypothetical protein